MVQGMLQNGFGIIVLDSLGKARKLICTENIQVLTTGAAIISICICLQSWDWQDIVLTL